MIHIKKRSFVLRMSPAIVTTGLWLLVDLLLNYLVSGQFDYHNYSGYKATANVLSAVRFGLIFLGTLVIYPNMFVLGAKPHERIIGSYGVVIAYMLTAMYRSTAFFSVGKAIYYGFNQVVSSNLVFQICLMCLAEIVCRWWYQRRYKDTVQIVRWGYVLGIVVGAGGLFAGLFWDGGVYWFYVYQELYKLLFL